MASRENKIIILFYMLFALCSGLLAAVGFAAPAQAQAPKNEANQQEDELSIKQLLLMPGQLTRAHADIEAKCQSCHVHFDKANQSPLCLDCHKEVNRDLKEKEGYHSFISPEKIADCSSCHSDHQGRDFDISALDSEHFDHRQTDFPLKGSHTDVSCNSCHQIETTEAGIASKDKIKPGFRLEVTSCSSCHRDPHQERLGDNCSSCHNENNWQKTTFDHDDTLFKLRDKHEQLACHSCHSQDVAVPVGTECANCHLAKDRHFTVFGRQCQDCHSPKGWEKTAFNHDRDTDFLLKGQHQELACSSCHAEISKPGKTCIDCHRQQDIHLGANSNECQQCHNNNSWKKAKFDHNKETLFPLLGAHRQQVCSSCHLPGQTPKEAPRACIDCHQSDDPHLGKLGQTCQDCHRQQSWHLGVNYNHDFNLFPLTGAHNLLVCESCHLSADFSNLQTSCISCHKNDDVHQQAFSEPCETCHNTAAWSSWQFDHQKQTRFPLTGAHQQLSCRLCHNQDFPLPGSPHPVLTSPHTSPHTSPKITPLQQPKCIDCHREHDAHQGSFGENCQQCHTRDSFHDIQF